MAKMLLTLLPPLLLLAGDTIADEVVDLPVGRLTILSGYNFQRVQGIDSNVFRITSESGFEINVDQGGMAGNYASLERNNNYPLIYGFEKDGNQVVIARSDTSDGPHFIVTYPEFNLNFFCRDPDSKELSEFYAMVLSFTDDE